VNTPAGTSDRNDALLSWYAASARALPWRGDADPYVTLVSESMLQQTQVDRVVPKFVAFVATWPNVSALAAAETRELLSLWSGLGYNARALRLRAAAAIIDAGGWPNSLVGLQSLPGVGPYTAGAIGSIAFGFDVPAIDTNLKRVLSRWFGSPLMGSRLKEFANAALGLPAGDWNQAVMDLGATLCRRREPQCSECPVSTWCQSPDVYEPPVRASKFSGSRRELRGALVRAHLHEENLHDTGTSLGWCDEDVAHAIEELTSEGLLEAGVRSPRSSSTAPCLVGS